MLAFRKRLDITNAIALTIFSNSEEERRKATQVLNFYTLVKKIIIRSSEADKTFNLRIFVGLVKQLRINMQILQAGFGPQK